MLSFIANNTRFHNMQFRLRTRVLNIIHIHDRVNIPQYRNILIVNRNEFSLFLCTTVFCDSFPSCAGNDGNDIRTMMVEASTETIVELFQTTTYVRKSSELSVNFPPKRVIKLE